MTLKISAAHFATLDQGFATLKPSYVEKYEQAVRGSGRYHDLKIRMRWELMRMALEAVSVDRSSFFDELYEYLNDSHIESALRALAAKHYPQYV